MSTGNLLIIDSLSVEFPGADRLSRRVLDNVSLELGAGEIVALVGESGGGKTLLGLSILGLLPPAAAWQGRILWRGREIHAGRREDTNLRGHQIAMIFQDAATSLDPVLTVGAQLDETVAHLQGRQTSAELRRRALSLLCVSGLEHPEKLIGRYPHQLSGGQRQRVMLALAIAGDPALLIADEPTTALDTQIRRAVLRQIGEVTKIRGASTLFITHDLSLAASIADRILVMQNGRLVEDGLPSAIMTQPKAEHTRELLRVLPINAPVREYRPDDTVPAALTLTGISVDYRRRSGFLGLGTSSITPLRSVDLSVRRGDAVALVGVSGCGKTTLARVASLLLEPVKGRVEIAGRELRPSAAGVLRRQTQMVFQDSQASLNPRLTCGRIIGEALNTFRGGGFRETTTAIESALSAVGLSPDFVDRLPHQLSGGQRQRIAIARALAVEPVILIADEPTSSLDVIAQASIMDLLATLRHEHALALLLITHDIQLALKNCRLVAVMYGGRILEVLVAGEEPLHPYTRLLLEATSETPELQQPGKYIPGTALNIANRDDPDRCPVAHFCRYCEDQCGRCLPQLTVLENERLVRCPVALRQLELH